MLVTKRFMITADIISLVVVFCMGFVGRQVWTDTNITLMYKIVWSIFAGSAGFTLVYTVVKMNKLFKQWK